MERREFFSESIQNFPSSVYHREATFFEKPSRCSLLIMLAQCASAYTRLLFLEADIHTTRHPPGTDSPINSRCLLHLLFIEWMNEWMVLPDNDVGQQQMDCCCGESIVSCRVKWMFESRRESSRGQDRNQAVHGQFQGGKAMLHGYFIYVCHPTPVKFKCHWPWVIALWKIKQRTLNKKFFSFKFGAKVVNSILEIEWGSIADGQCLNRHHMDLYKEKKIILCCKNAFGFHMGDMHPHVSVRWFCYKRLFLD